jgi:hypothetical protein
VSPHQEPQSNLKPKNWTTNSMVMALSMKCSTKTNLKPKNWTMSPQHFEHAQDQSRDSLRPLHRLSVAGQKTALPTFVGFLYVY